MLNSAELLGYVITEVSASNFVVVYLLFVYLPRFLIVVKQLT